MSEKKQSTSDTAGPQAPEAASGVHPVAAQRPAQARQSAEVPILGETGPAGISDSASANEPPAPSRPFQDLRQVTEGTTGTLEGPAPVADGVRNQVLQPALGAEVQLTPDTTVRTLTQEEVNRLLGTTRQEARLRLLKELGGFESAEQAKAALGALADATARAQVAEDALTAAQAERAEVERTWHEAEAGLKEQLADVRARSAVYVEASRMGFRDPSDAYHMLDREALGKAPDPAEAVHDALEALASSKPYLLVVAPGIGVTNPGRQERPPESDGERRRRLYGTGGTPIGRGPGGGVFMPEGYQGPA